MAVSTSKKSAELIQGIQLTGAPDAGKITKIREQADGVVLTAAFTDMDTLVENGFIHIGNCPAFSIICQITKGTLTAVNFQVKFYDEGLALSFVQLSIEEAAPSTNPKHTILCDGAGHFYQVGLAANAQFCFGPIINPGFKYVHVMIQGVGAQAGSWANVWVTRTFNPVPGQSW